MSLWLVIAGMAALTFGQRASFLLLPDRVETPLLLRRALRYVPAAVLTAIWAPEPLLEDQGLYLGVGNEKLLAGSVSIAPACGWRSTSATAASRLAAPPFFRLPCSNSFPLR